MIKVELDQSSTLTIAEALHLSEKKYEQTKCKGGGFSAVYRRVKFLHDLFSNLDVSPEDYEITITKVKAKGATNG